MPINVFCISGVHLRKGNTNKSKLPAVVFCCSQTCKICFGELLTLDISVPSSSVSYGHQRLHCLRLFVVVHKLVFFCFGELLSWDISVPSFIVTGSNMSKLWA